MPRRVALGLVAVAALGLLVRWSWVLGVDPDVPEVGDASAYHLLADGLADGEGYVRPFDRVLFDLDRPTAEYPPLHPSVLAVAAWTGVDGVTGQRLWLSLFGAASVALTGALAWRLAGGSNRVQNPVPRAEPRAGGGFVHRVRVSARGWTSPQAAAIVAGAVAAVHPLWFQADATLMPETLAALLGGGVVLLAVDASRRPSVGRAAVLGAVCGLAILTRTEAVVLLVAVAVPAVLRNRRAVAAALASAALVVAPWIVRNAVRFDRFVPVSTNAGSVADGANCPATYGGDLLGYWQFGPGCFEGFTQDELAADDEATVADRHRRAGVEFATDHVDEWPKVAAARLGRTVGLFRPGQLADLGALEGRRQWADMAGYVLVWSSLALAVVGARRLRRAGRPWWVPAVAVGAVWGSTALTYGNPRFLALAQPSLVALAACGVVRRR